MKPKNEPARKKAKETEEKNQSQKLKSEFGKALGALLRTMEKCEYDLMVDVIADSPREWNEKDARHAEDLVGLFRAAIGKESEIPSECSTRAKAVQLRGYFREPVTEKDKYARFDVLKGVSLESYLGIAKDFQDYVRAVEGAFIAKAEPEKLEALWHDYKWDADPLLNFVLKNLPTSFDERRAVLTALLDLVPRVHPVFDELRAAVHQMRCAAVESMQLAKTPPPFKAA